MAFDLLLAFTSSHANEQILTACLLSRRAHLDVVITAFLCVISGCCAAGLKDLLCVHVETCRSGCTLHSLRISAFISVCFVGFFLQ